MFFFWYFDYFCVHSNKIYSKIIYYKNLGVNNMLTNTKFYRNKVLIYYWALLFLIIKYSHLVDLSNIYFIKNFLSSNILKTYFKFNSCCWKKEIIMKSKPTLQESKPVFFLFLFLSTNNECLMFLNIKKAFDSVSYFKLFKNLLQFKIYSGLFILLYLFNF